MSLLNDDAKAMFDTLALFEEPMGIFYTDSKPAECISPKEGKLQTYEQEQKGEVNYRELFKNFSCIFQSVWRARRKKTAACFDTEHFGCLGGAFNLGYLKPQLEVIVRYVSTGIAGALPGEHYLDSPETVRKFFDLMDPRPAPARFCVFKPLSKLGADEKPELVIFFDRPEVIAGMHQLCCFVTKDYEAVRSLFGAGCSNVVSWPLHYLKKGELKAFLGGWDPACRKFFRVDEITLTMPYELYLKLVACWRDSFLTHDGSGWKETRKRALRSRDKWGESEEAKGGKEEKDAQG